MQNYYFIVTCVMMGAVGLCVGSFLNVVVYRLPVGMSLAKPASHCPSCNHTLAWYDNVPLFSFLFLGGKCRYCKTKISPRYFCVELLNAALWLCCAFAFFRNYGVWAVIVNALALSVLLCMALIDEEHLFIPDRLQIALLILGVCGIFASGVQFWQTKLYGMLLGGGFFLFFYLISFPLFGREGLGFGDVKLMTSAGLLLGLKSVCVAIVIAIVMALIDVIVRRVAFKNQKDPFGGANEFAFAPYLAAGVAAALFFGDSIAAWYFSMLV